jgi:hypothetical protein
VRTGGILIESKEAIRKRLGRSTNKGDAVVMAWSEGEVARRRSDVRRWPAIAAGYDPLRIDQPEYRRYLQHRAFDDDWERPAWRDNPTSGIDDFDPFEHR